MRPSHFSHCPLFFFLTFLLAREKRLQFSSFSSVLIGEKGRQKEKEEGVALFIVYFPQHDSGEKLTARLIVESRRSGQSFF